MSGLLAVLAREIEERRLLLAAALLLGLLPLAAPALPGMAGGDAALARHEAAVGLSLIVCAVLALFLGGSVIAGDLAERRLGFYFSRPLAGWAIWLGKIGAALLLACGAAILVPLPVWLIDRITHGSGPFPPQLPELAVQLPAVVAGALFLLLVAHVTAVTARSRSSWLALDLAGAMAVAALAWASWRRLAFEGALPYLAPLAMPLASALLLLLLATSGAEVIAGRSDLRRAHRIQALVLWASLVPAAIAGAGFARWMVEISPADLQSFNVAAASPGESWIAAYGTAAHRGGFRSLFLIDTRSGAYVRTRAAGGFMPPAAAPPLFAGGGGRVAWLEPQGDPRSSPLELLTLDLVHPGARPVRSPVVVGWQPRMAALSAAGSLIAMLEDHRYRLTVTEIDDGRLLASTPLPAGEAFEELRFVAPGRLQLYRAEMLSADSAPDGNRLGSPEPPEPPGQEGPTLSLEGVSRRVDDATGKARKLGPRKAAAPLFARRHAPAAGDDASPVERASAPTARPRRFASPVERLTVYELDVAAPRLRQVISIAPLRPRSWEVSADGERILAREPGPLDDLDDLGQAADGARRIGYGELLLYDARSGRALARLPAAAHAVFLADGRIVEVVRGAGRELRLLDRDGVEREPRRRFTFPDARGVWIDRQPAGERLLVSLVRGGGAPGPVAQHELHALDLSTGRSLLLPPRLAPLNIPVQALTAPLSWSFASHLFRDRNGLVRFDLDSGRERHLFTAHGGG
ncbi:MAG TPA: hypothetical protein VHR45_10645 [Thermoanaerobaculia bacterium]|nr:hypothetical protein [Thermoanaerobaculia bacterium]